MRIQGQVHTFPKIELFLAYMCKKLCLRANVLIEEERRKSIVAKDHREVLRLKYLQVF